jgi:Leucine-rich repeat (LRR) protein
LRCEDCDLESLDVTKNTALTQLDCHDNSLKSLNVSKNTELTQLKCHDNSLESLDVSKNTALTTLDCSLNSLASLDISKNTALTDLDCSQNSLESLDVSKNTALTYLSCYRNQIKGSSMDNLVNGLPDTQGTLIAFSDYTNEENVITKVQVKVATDKGWKVRKVGVLESGDWYLDYAGLGDINGDNQINQADLDLLAKIIMGQQPAYVLPIRGDINKDGKTDAADIVVMVNILNGK